jgi:hypothetical protein
MLMPNVMASVIHIPGVTDTKKKVGTNTDNNAQLMAISGSIIRGGKLPEKPFTGNLSVAASII